MTQLSTNFTVADGTKSAEATRRGISNEPTPEMVENMRRVATEILEPVMAHFGKRPTINSWLRVEALEKAINWGGDNEKSAFALWCKKRGKPVSDASWPAYFATKSHPKGEACDFEVAGVDNKDLAHWCRDNLPSYDQIICEFYKPGVPDSGWVHGSISGGRNRRELFTIDGTGTKPGLPS